MTRKADLTYLHAIMDCYTAAIFADNDRDGVVLDRLMLLEGQRCGLNAYEIDDLFRERRAEQFRYAKGRMEITRIRNEIFGGIEECYHKEIADKLDK